MGDKEVESAGNKKICLTSLGCPKNLVDSEVMLGILKKSGFAIVTEEEKADILIVNTCGFIGDAKKESIDAILKLAEYKKSGPSKTLIVAGCLTQRYKEELLSSLPEVDFFIGTGEYQRIAEIIRNGREKKVYADFPAFIHDYTFPRLLSTPAHYAYVKIAEGCRNFCSYCVIPEIRGNFRSRTVESIVREVEGLGESGVKEVNLVAQDTTSYGADKGKNELISLLRRLKDISAVQWIRLLYLYPGSITDELIEEIGGEKKICKYMDMPIQHINTRLLKKMNRHYTRKDVTALINRIRKKISNAVIRTSLIVGFPGETGGEFKELLSFVKDMSFDRLGVFEYSREEGTPACGMRPQVREEVKAERFKKIMEAQKRISLDKNRALIGYKVRVLVDGKGGKGDGTGKGKGDEFICGRHEGQAPEVDGVTYVRKGRALPGDMMDAVITDAKEYDIFGIPSL